MATIRRHLNILFCLSLFCLSSPISALAIKKEVDPKVQDRAVYAVVNDFIIEIRKGNVSKAYQTFTSHDFRENTSIAQFASFVSQFPTLRRNRSVELVNIQYHENVATMQVTLTSLEHETNRAVIFLRYDEGRWRVMSMQVFSGQRA